MYFIAMRSTISQPASPSIHSTTRPRMMTGSYGLSAGARDSATRASRRRLRAFWESGLVRKTILSSRVLTQSGIECGEPSGRTVARCATEVLSTARRTAGFSMVRLLVVSGGSADDFVVQVGDARRGYGLDQPELHVLRKLLEERPSTAEQDRHLVQEELVDQACLQRCSHDAATHQRDILAAGQLARRGDCVLDGVRQGLPIADLRNRTAAQHDRPSVRVRAATAEVAGVVVRLVPDDDRTDPAGRGVEHAGAWLAELEAVERLARRVTVEVPVEQHRRVAESAVRTGVATADVPVDRDREGAEDLAHRAAFRLEFPEETPGP